MHAFIISGNKKSAKINMSYMTYQPCKPRTSFRGQKEFVRILIDCLEDRFNDCNNKINDTMKWFDSIYWESDNKTYAFSDFEKLYDIFHESLEEASYDKHCKRLIQLPKICCVILVQHESTRSVEQNI